MSKTSTSSYYRERPQIHKFGESAFVCDKFGGSLQNGLQSHHALDNLIDSDDPASIDATVISRTHTHARSANSPLAGSLRCTNPHFGKRPKDEKEGVSRVSYALSTHSTPLKLRALAMENKSLRRQLDEVSITLDRVSREVISHDDYAAETERLKDTAFLLHSQNRSLSNELNLIKVQKIKPLVKQIEKLDDERDELATSVVTLRRELTQSRKLLAIERERNHEGFAFTLEKEIGEQKNEWEAVKSQLFVQIARYQIELAQARETVRELEEQRSSLQTLVADLSLYNERDSGARCVHCSHCSDQFYTKNTSTGVEIQTRKLSSKTEQTKVSEIHSPVKSISISRKANSERSISRNDHSEFNSRTRALFKDKDSVDAQIKNQEARQCRVSGRELQDFVGQENTWVTRSSKDIKSTLGFSSTNSMAVTTSITPPPLSRSKNSRFSVPEIGIENHLSKNECMVENINESKEYREKNKERKKSMKGIENKGKETKDNNNNSIEPQGGATFPLRQRVVPSHRHATFDQLNSGNKSHGQVEEVYLRDIFNTVNPPPRPILL